MVNTPLSSHKFKARYATFGFSDKTDLDEGIVWPVFPIASSSNDPRTN
jgi:hypothetical protein